MPPLRRLPPALAVCALLAGCGSLPFSGEEAPAPSATKRQLAVMVLPRDELGTEADGLRQSRQAGPRDNAAEAEGTIDPDDDAEELRLAGRQHGYRLAYTAPDGARKGVLEVGTSVEVFETELAASRYLHDQADDHELLRGKRVAPGVRLVASERLDPGALGEEARAFRATVRAGRQRLYGTVVAFRHGRLVAAATLARFDDADVAARARELAAALERRIVAVLAGTLAEPPEPLEGGRAADPRPDTLAAGDLPTLELELLHEGRVSPGRVRAFLREFDVTGGSLDRSHPFYVRTLAQTFPDREAAEEHGRLLRSSRGARTIARRFVAAWLREHRAKASNVRAEPAARPGDDALGIRFTFDAPVGPMSGSYVVITRERSASSVLVVGHADSLREDDLLPLLDVLRARLAGRG